MVVAKAAHPCSRSILGMLMPAFNNPKRDRNIFLKILTMDDDGAWQRCKGDIPVVAWREAPRSGMGSPQSPRPWTLNRPPTGRHPEQVIPGNQTNLAPRKLERQSRSNRRSFTAPEQPSACSLRIRSSSAPRRLGLRWIRDPLQHMRPHILHAIRDDVPVHIENRVLEAQGLNSAHSWECTPILQHAIKRGVDPADLALPVPLHGPASRPRSIAASSSRRSIAASSSVKARQTYLKCCAISSGIRSAPRKHRAPPSGRGRTDT